MKVHEAEDVNKERKGSVSACKKLSFAYKDRKKRAGVIFYRGILILVKYSIRTAQ
jgi:hypothetical protein